MTWCESLILQDHLLFQDHEDAFSSSKIMKMLSVNQTEHVLDMLAKAGKEAGVVPFSFRAFLRSLIFRYALRKMEYCDSHICWSSTKCMLIFHHIAC